MTEISTQTIVSCNDHNDVVFSWASASGLLMQMFAEVVSSIGEQLQISLNDSIHTTVTTNILKKKFALSPTCDEVSSTEPESSHEFLLSHISPLSTLSEGHLSNEGQLSALGEMAALGDMAGYTPNVEAGVDTSLSSKLLANWSISPQRSGCDGSCDSNDEDVSMKDEPGEEAGTTDDLSAKPLVTFTPPPYPFISNEVLNVLKTLNESLPDSLQRPMLPSLLPPESSLKTSLMDTLPYTSISSAFDRKQTAFEVYKKSPLVKPEADRANLPFFSLPSFKADLSPEWDKVNKFNNDFIIRPYKCPHCSARFSLRQRLVTHIQAKHAGKTFFTCHRCKITFFGEMEYEEHIKTHPKGKYNCKFCPMTFKTPTGLTVHENVHTRRQVWLCQLCGKTYSSRASYIQHLQVMHSSGRKFQCPVCGKMSSTSSNLKVHMVIHSNAKPFKCPQCDMTFKRKGCLKSHFIRRHPAKSVESGDKLCRGGQEASV